MSAKVVRYSDLTEGEKVARLDRRRPVEVVLGEVTISVPALGLRAASGWLARWFGVLQKVEALARDPRAPKAEDETADPGFTREAVGLYPEIVEAVEEYLREAGATAEELDVAEHDATLLEMQAALLTIAPRAMVFTKPTTEGGETAGASPGGTNGAGASVVGGAGEGTQPGAAVPQGSEDGATKSVR